MTPHIVKLPSVDRGRSWRRNGTSLSQKCALQAVSYIYTEKSGPFGTVWSGSTLHCRRRRSPVRSRSRPASRGSCRLQGVQGTDQHYHQRPHAPNDMYSCKQISINLREESPIRPQPYKLQSKYTFSQETYMYVHTGLLVFWRVLY